MTNSLEPNRVAIVFWETYLGCAPSIINAARALSEAGFFVDLYIRLGEGFAQPPKFHSKVRLRIIDTKASVVRTWETGGAETAEATDSAFRRLVRCILPDSVRQPVGRWWDRSCVSDERSTSVRAEAFAIFSQLCVEEILNCPPLVVIGVDTFGITAASEATNRLQSMQRNSQNPRPELWYWSLEILRDCDDDSEDWIGIRQREKSAHAASDLVVIQDSERAAFLNQSNGQLNVPVVMVPNAPRGSMKMAEKQRAVNFGVNDQDRRFVVHAGSVCDGMRSADLARSAAGWPEPYDLVFHSHTLLTRHDTYASGLVDLGNGRVHLSKKPVDYDQLDSLYAAAEMSLVVYDSSLGPNFQLLAGASGKLAHSLRCGVPVISVDNPSIAAVLHDNHCGIGVSHPHEVADAIQTIASAQEDYCLAAIQCFEDHYDFDRHFAPLLERIRNVELKSSDALVEDSRV